MRPPEIAHPLLPRVGHRASEYTHPARRLSLAIVTIASILAFWPTLHSGFLPLGFDDAIIADTEAIRGFSAANLWAMATEFNHAHYVPLTMLSLAIDYHFWGLNPFGYHLTNGLLHALTATLACVFLWRVMPSAPSALLAALLFALHPMQMEAVSLAIQRKTVLSGALFFLTLILYQRWCAGRSRWAYAAALLTFTAAALTKPSVVTLPVLLLLYDYAFDGRVRWLDKLPFLAVAVLVVRAAIGAHAAVGAVYPPHGGNLLAHGLMMGRVTLEYVTAWFVPLTLSPVYYYQLARVYEPLNFLALAVVCWICGYVTLRRQRYRWSFWCLGWFVLVLAPESNIVPVPQLRADRFLYLPMLGFAMGVAVAWERLARRRRVAAGALAGLVVAALGVLTYTSAGVWRDDVSAWQRVAERHPWSAVAYNMLGRALYDRGDAVAAEQALGQAVHLNAQLAEPHLYLAKLYAQHGHQDFADVEVRRYLELAPNSPEGLQLLDAIRQASDS